MEELATLMLEMDLAEKGEPSFTIAAGNRKSAPTETEAGSVLIEGEPGKNLPVGCDSTPLLPELLHHLVDYFVMHFNTFHQFLDSNDVIE